VVRGLNLFSCISYFQFCANSPEAKRGKVSPPIPRWELDANFDPLSVMNDRVYEEWCNYAGEEVQPSPLSPSAESVSKKEGIFDLNYLPFRNPSTFVAGGLHNHLDEWERITSNPEVLDWIRHGVDVTQYFKHFKGNFKGKAFDSDIPPQAIFPNNESCKIFGDFIKQTLLDRVRNGSLSVWGRVGDCDPPLLVMPMTVEPSKPRLCHDERYLNCWMKDSPFSLDTLREVPRMISQDMYMTTLDDKSGYDHLKLAENTSTFFGLRFGHWYLVYNTLPFGFKPSAYIYHTTGMVVTSYCRNLGVPCLQYIDDRLLGEYLDRIRRQVCYDRILDAYRALYIVCEVLTRVGYTISLSKSEFVPVQSRRFLGLLTDSIKQAFLLPDDKRKKFAALRDYILSLDKVDVKTLQRFVGKCISFILAIPAAKLYTREVNKAISVGIRSSRQVVMTGDLKNEIQHWTFLDTWQDFLPWRSEKHLQISLSTDASLFKWGALVKDGLTEVSLGDYWAKGDDRPIHLKEAQALLLALSSIKDRIVNCRVDALVDNMALVHTWNGESGRDSSLVKLIKDLFQLTYKSNADLRIQYIPSKQNPADKISRQLGKNDVMLAEEKWFIIQERFGPHSVDLMALDSNSMKNGSGIPLRHFTPYPTPGSAGLNVFAQDLSQEKNPYVFPPIPMIAPLLKFLSGSVSVCTMIVPVLDPLPVWWPTLWNHVRSYITVGKKREKGVIWEPSKKGFVADNVGLPRELLAVRLIF
jgi:hypothetical protein